MLDKFNVPFIDFIAEHCNWEFKSAECGYNGPAPSCNRTYDDCKKLGNTKRFGGFRGLAPGGFRIVF